LDRKIAACAAASSLAGALSVASRMGPQGTQLADAAKSSFVDGMGIALFVGAIVIGIAAVIARKLMPAEVEDADHVGDIAPVDDVELELLSA